MSARKDFAVTMTPLGVPEVPDVSARQPHPTTHSGVMAYWGGGMDAARAVLHCAPTGSRRHVQRSVTKSSCCTIEGSGRGSLSRSEHATHCSRLWTATPGRASTASHCDVPNPAEPSPASTPASTQGIVERARSMETRTPSPSLPPQRLANEQQCAPSLRTCTIPPSPPPPRPPTPTQRQARTRRLRAQTKSVRSTMTTPRTKGRNEPVVPADLRHSSQGSVSNHDVQQGAGNTARR
jgi:hypothetical protein